MRWRCFRLRRVFLVRRPAKTDCLILDMRMPGMTGPELQQELIRRGQKIPTIFITAHNDEGMIARVMGRGAVGCLFKPFSEDSLLKALSKALTG